MVRAKFLVPGIIGILTLLLVPLVLPSVPRVHAVPRSVTLVGHSQAWNQTSFVKNPTIKANPGDVVTLTLKPGDLFQHRFHLDVDYSGTRPNCPPDKCSATFIDPNTITYTFTVDFSAATHKYYCSVHPFTMVGDFVVTIPSAGPAGRGPLRL